MPLAKRQTGVYFVHVVSGKARRIPDQMNANARPAIMLDRVSKRFPLHSSARQRFRDILLRRNSGEHWALRDVDLHIAPGEAVGIIGGNGAGKSTLLGLVAGTTKPTRGTVHVSGRVAALLELGAGFHPDWTGRQNSEFHMRLRGASRREAMALVEEVEAFAAVDHYFDQPLRTCSSGTAVRIAFAAAVAIKPDILIVDEALAVGDASFQHKCFRRIAEFKASGVTILLVTHRLDIVPQLCSRAILLDGGSVYYDGMPGEALARYLQVLCAGGAPRGHNEGGSEPEFRTGTSEASVTAVSAYAGGTETTSFAIGETASFQVDVVFRKDIERPVLGFAIRTVEGMILYSVNSDMLGQTMSPARAGERCRITIECPLPLSQGPVFTDFSIADLSGGEALILDARMSMLRLEIHGDGKFWGLVDLGASIRPLETIEPKRRSTRY